MMLSDVQDGQLQRLGTHHWHNANQRKGRRDTKCTTSMKSVFQAAHVFFAELEVLASFNIERKNRLAANTSRRHACQWMATFNLTESDVSAER